MSKQGLDNTTTLDRPSNPRIQSWKSFYSKLQKNKAAMVGGFLILFFIVVAIIGPFITPYDPDAQIMVDKLSPPSVDYWFGTDHLGRDILSRIIHGMKITLYIGFFSVILGGTVGVFLGIVSGYYGKRTDMIIMRCMYIILASPGILLALAIVPVLVASLLHVIIAFE